MPPPEQTLILHAQWIPGDRWLNVRGEGLRSFRGYRPRPRYDHHPYLVSEPELREALRAITGPRRSEFWPRVDPRESEHRFARYRLRRQNGDKLGVGETGTILQPFLADDGSPAPSPELRALAGLPPAAPDSERPREITGPLLRMGPLHAFYFLTHIHGEPPPVVSGGASLRFYHAAARWVQALLMDGHFLPALIQPDEAPRHRGAHRLRALWKLVPPPGPLADERTRLITAPPEVAAEFSPACAEGLPLAALFEDFTAELADTVLRGWAEEELARSDAAHGGRRGPQRRPGVLEEWFAALAVESRGYDAPETLVGDLQRWSREAAALADPDWRLALKLSSPPDGDDEGLFRLEFLWQHRREPARFAPVMAAETFPLADGPATVSRTLLAALTGRVSSLANLRGWPLPGALFSGPVSLAPADALNFLELLAPHLAQADAGLSVPAWWTGARSGLTARLALDDYPAKAGEVAVENLISFEWQLALGGRKLTDEEFRKLADAKGALVKLGGKWVALKADDQAAVKKLEKMKGRAGRLSAIGALRLASGLDLPPGGLPLESVEAAGRMAKILEGEKKFEERPEPPGFVGTLRPYQRRGLSWLAYLDELGLGACLADDMGLGKTVQLLALLAHERADAKGEPGPTLLVCPMSVVGNWRREAERFTPGLKSVIHHGLQRKEGEEFVRQAKHADLVITTYSLLQRDLEHLKPVIWRRVVLDEAQNIKNPLAKQSRAARELIAAHRVALTGTPVENRLSELWSIMEFLNGGLLGTHETFNRQFARPIEKGGDEYRATQLRRIIQPFLLRRLKTDKSIIADLPDKMEMEIACTLTKEQAALYQAIVNEMMGKIDGSAGIERKGLILAALTRLKQVCDHPALLPGGSKITGRRSGKLMRLEEILEEAVEEGDQSLVFTQFSEMGEVLHKHLPKRLGCEVFFLHGGTTLAAREKLVAEFQAGKAPVFILSLKAGGTGLNLTAARQVIHFDRWWNPAVEDQATGRAFRIGQTKDVQVRKFVCAGTLEERIAKMIGDKRALADRIVGAGEAWLTELSTGQIRELVTLDPEAVADE